MEGKDNIFIWNGLIVNTLRGPGFVKCLCEMSEVNIVYRRSYKFDSNLKTSK